MFIEAELYMQKNQKKNQSWENDVTERRADGPMKTNSNSTSGIHKVFKKNKKKKKQVQKLIKNMRYSVTLKIGR